MRTTMYWIILALLFLVSGYYGYQDSEDDLKLYCDGVKDHQQNPRSGWPDYNGIFDSECLK